MNNSINTNLRSLICKHFLTMSGYISAGMGADKSADLIFMNANENPYLLKGCDGLAQYPQPQPPALLEAMANAYSISPQQIIATRGADEAISLITRFICNPHSDAILIHPPTFGMYGAAADTIPARTEQTPMLRRGGSFHIDAQAIIDTAKGEARNIKAVFLCSPNNPTGGAIDEADIKRICTELEGHAAVILDEAYIEFAAVSNPNIRSATEYMHEHGNLIILRTLSKTYSLAGGRIGALICHDTSFIDLLRSTLLDAYPLPTPSVNAAIAALSQGEAVQRNISDMLAQRDILHAALSQMGFVQRIYHSDANFLLVQTRSPEDADSWVQHCASHGYILRNFAHKEMLEGCARLSPGTQEQNARFIEICREYDTY